MAVGRTFGASLLCAALGGVLGPALAVGPAAAHGAPENPVSRGFACGPLGGANARTAACVAAREASDPDAIEHWDNLRLSNVGGRDREAVPDGRLCSGGLDGYRGLDLARTDWPATRLTPGANFTFRYRETIAHTGTFRLYVTRAGYTPARPLRWSDLEDRPFLTVTDPPLKDERYIMAGRLPAGWAGRHVIYAIWQNSSTPDTYYSCSDVVFGSAAPSGSASAAAGSPAAGGESPAAAQPSDAAVPVRSVSASGRRSVLPWAGVGAGVLALMLGGVLAARSGVRLRRRPGRHGG